MKERVIFVCAFVATVTLFSTSVYFFARAIEESDGFEEIVVITGKEIKRINHRIQEEN